MIRPARAYFVFVLLVVSITLNGQVDIDTLQQVKVYSNWQADTLSKSPDLGNDYLNNLARERTVLHKQLSFKNSDDDSLKCWLYGAGQKELIVVRVHDRFYYNGIFMPKYLRANLHMNKAIPIVLAPGDSVALDIFYFNQTTSTLTDRFLLLSNEYFNENAGFRDEVYKNGNTIFLIFEGAVVVMMLYTIFLFFQNSRQRLYLYYSGYLFFALAYMTLKISSVGPFYFIAGNHPILSFVFNESVQFLMFIFYNIFVINILDIKRKAPKLFKIIFILNLVYLLYALFDLGYISFTLDREFRKIAFPISRSFMLIVSVYLIIQAYRRVKSPLVNYILAGSVIFMVGNALAMFYSLQLSWLPGINFFAINFSQMGIFGEALLFSMGIGYWIKLNRKERKQLREAYIAQLEENQKINERAKQELTDKVEERTREIMAQQKSIEKEKEAKMRLEYEKKAMEHELNALKLQMNPHFIFNSLNSIRYYILKHKASKASDFITNFARLLRMILHHSKQSIIPLKDELKALELYMSFEKERLNEGFTYDIQIDDSIDPEVMGIQPLLLQPFIENSIWHGLSRKKEKGHIKIGFERQDGVVEIIIEDNGIGREAAKITRKKSLKKQKSYGLEITKERLSIINRMNNNSNDFNVIDLYHDDGTPAGTRVEVTLVYQEYEG